MSDEKKKMIKDNSKRECRQALSRTGNFEISARRQTSKHGLLIINWPHAQQQV
jgi:hypothetical protein